MLSTFLTTNINNGPYKALIPKFVQVGFGQVEPNHLSAQRTGQIYAQLPAAADIQVLQQGQFVKYDYVHGEVNFGEKGTTGEWMLVYNETKLYRDGQRDCEFAMIKDNYEARVYSPFGGTRDGEPDTINFDGQGGKQSRYYNGQEYTVKPAAYKKTEDEAIQTGKTYYTEADGVYTEVASPVADNLTIYYEMVPAVVHKEDVTAGPDYYEPYYNEDPFKIAVAYTEQLMKEGTKMVPRVFKTNVGDIFTTNTINNTADQITLGAILTPNATGILEVNNSPAATDMQWQVVKVYTMPDHQPGVKIMRIA